MGRSSEGMREVSIRDIPCVMRKFRFEDVKRFLTPPPSKLDCAWAWASMLRIAKFEATIYFYGYCYILFFQNQSVDLLMLFD